MEDRNGVERAAGERRAAVRALVLREHIATQEELARRLAGRGFAVTQPAVSQDLRALGAVKESGRWRLPPDRFAGIGGLVETFAPAGPHLVVVRTLPGAAQRVGHAIDTAEWPEAAGSVAGDDTLFVASAGAAEQRRLLERLYAALGGGNGSPSSGEEAPRPRGDRK